MTTNQLLPEYPKDYEAELWVLGSVLLNRDILDELISKIDLKPEDFFDEHAAGIYRCMLDIHAKGRTPDVKLITDLINKSTNAERKTDTLALLLQAVEVPTYANWSYYAHRVRYCSTRRKLINASSEINGHARSEYLDESELLDFCEKQVFSVLEDRVKADAVPVGDILADAMDQLDKAKAGATQGIKTGLTELDRILGGLRDGELIIVAGRTSMGKTALAANIAENVSLSGKSTLFISLEMAQLELGNRIMCSHARVCSKKVRDGFISKEERARLVESCGEIGTAPLFIDDTASRTTASIAAIARRWKRKYDLRLIVVDYLQFVQPDNARDPRQEQVAAIARKLKHIARELSVPVICLAQLNRQVEASKDNKPKLSHLRESGAIEQDADVVLFVHREEYYASQQEMMPGGSKADCKGKAQLIIAKHRNGPTGEVNLAWFDSFTRFDNLAASVGPMQEWDGAA